jgi:SAM-dependent methyltransferase
MAGEYVHGYSEREAERLRDQAATVRHLLHRDTHYPAGSLVLEAPCGVGAQTITLARKSPEARFLAVDLSWPSLEQARAMAVREGLSNVRFQQADVFRLPYAEASFDHVFVCYLLEHLADPEGALAALGRVLKPGGSMTVIEGDHGSAYFHPETKEAVRAWNCLIEVQASLGADSLIGRRLYPLMSGAGFRDVVVTPLVIYCDASTPEYRDGFAAKTISAMVEGVEERALAMGLMDRESWRKGIADLYRVAECPEGVFNYTFFKATGWKPAPARM